MSWKHPLITTNPPPRAPEEPVNRIEPIAPKSPLARADFEQAMSTDRLAAERESRANTLHNTRLGPIRALAIEYHTEAGAAFARGDDARATAFRDAAKAIIALAESLPVLPAPGVR